MPLTDAQIRHFEEQGYLVLPGLLPLEASAPLRRELADIVEFEARRFHAAGKVPETFAEAPFEKRLVKLCEAADDPQEMKEAVTGGKRMKTEAVFKLWTHPVLLDAVEQLIGPEILAHPQFALRSKMAFQARFPAIADDIFHQDGGFLLEESKHTRMVNCWMPLVDVTRDMGAIQFVRGSHKLETVFPHRLEHEIGHPESWYLYIAEEDMPAGERVRVDVPLGAVLWHQNMLVHRSTENHSDKVRWTCDLRYQQPGLPTGFPATTSLVPIRKSDDPDYRLDWDSWISEGQEGNQSYRRLTEDNFEYSSLDSPWLVRWRKYWEEAA